MFWIIFTVLWFASGIAFAPRAAALGYEHSIWNPDDYAYIKDSIEHRRRDDAKTAFWFSVMLGPACMVFWFISKTVVPALQSGTIYSVDKALLKHSLTFQAVHLDSLVSENERLAIENERLTRQVLDS